jgi:hypothetical protein
MFHELVHGRDRSRSFSVHAQLRQQAAAASGDHAHVAVQCCVVTVLASCDSECLITDYCSVTGAAAAAAAAAAIGGCCCSCYR